MGRENDYPDNEGNKPWAHPYNMPCPVITWKGPSTQEI